MLTKRVMRGFAHAEVRRRGAAAVELALGLPLYLLILAGRGEVGRITEVREVM